MTSPALIAAIRDLRLRWRASDVEYRAHPNAMCGGFRELSDGSETYCPNVAHQRDWLCNGCRKRAARKP